MFSSLLRVVLFMLLLPITLFAMDIPAIEKTMSEEGMLQRYPRDRQ